MARKNGWDTLVSKDRQKANGITEETITESGKVKKEGVMDEKTKKIISENKLTMKAQQKVPRDKQYDQISREQRGREKKIMNMPSTARDVGEAVKEAEGAQKYIRAINRAENTAVNKSIDRQIKTKKAQIRYKQKKAKAQDGRNPGEKFSY